MDDEDDELASTNLTPVPGARPSRARSPVRVITRPSFLLDLQRGSPVGEYEIESQIGEGAMGTVYTAVQPLIGKHVAIKVLKPELCANQQQIDRFIQEAQAVNQIGHPNIVDVFSLGELPDGRAYFVMELLRGEDLRVRLARGPMSVEDTADVLDGIARALETAHAKGIVHRDLKPDNVFLHQVDNGPRMVKLLDFGIAKLVHATPGAAKTQTGNMLGTPRYISPEQARGINVDQRSDIYSLGIMAYEMLAGRAPFEAESAMDLVVLHLSEPPPALSQFAKVPRSIERCVMRMLEKDPANRPSLDEIRAILVDPSRRLTPLPFRSHLLSGRRRGHRVPRLLLAGAATVGAGVLSWRLVSSPAPAPKADVRLPPVASAPPAPVTVEPAPATVEPPPPPARAALQVDISGSKDAVVLVDHKEWGRGAAIRVELDAGSHQIEVRPPGRPSISRTIELAPGQDKTVEIAVPVPPAPPVRHIVKPTASDDDDGLLRPKGHR